MSVVPGVSLVLGLVCDGVVGVGLSGSEYFTLSRGSPASWSELFREGVVEDEVFDKISEDLIPVSMDVVAGEPPHIDSHTSKYSH